MPDVNGRSTSNVRTCDPVGRSRSTSVCSWDETWTGMGTVERTTVGAPDVGQSQGSPERLQELTAARDEVLAKVQAGQELLPEGRRAGEG